MSKRIYTTYYPCIMNKEIATKCYFQLKDNIQWEESIRSKKGFTRMGKIVHLSQLPSEVIETVVRALSQYDPNKNITIAGVYANYYVNGDYWCPNHTHKGSMQVILSLGSPRTLTVGKKQYLMNNGDVIIFGSSIHGIPKEPVNERDEFKGGRISLAFFIDV